jgi:hypothetical protein
MPSKPGPDGHKLPISLFNISLEFPLPKPHTREIPVAHTDVKIILIFALRLSRS